MKKSELREKYKLKRKELSKADLDKASLNIANQLLKLNIWNKDFYHIFLPIESKNEINTEYILNILNGKDKNIVLPKSDFSNFALTHFLLTDATKINLNEYGIPEPVDGIDVSPEKLDVIFVPLLAFDEKGNRLGYGKGFYDRFLSQCRSDAIKIGLSQFEAESREFRDMLKTDIRLDFCVCPDKIYEF